MSAIRRLTGALAHAPVQSLCKPTRSNERAAGEEMILALMRIPPDLNGHGGSQRAWRLTEALLRIAPVHFVLLYRQSDKDAESVELAPLANIVESVTRIEIPEWRPSPRRFKVVPGAVFDLAGMRSHEAPRISSRGLRKIAESLPVREATHLFAGRLPSAFIGQSLLERGLIKVDHKVVDFDDIMSRYRRREIARGMSPLSKLKSQADVYFLEKAESEIARNWDAVSVCTDEDVRLLQEMHAGSTIVKVPNVIDHNCLPVRRRSDAYEILFVGNLSFRPNVQGLMRFVEGAWPELRRSLPKVQLKVVGMNPVQEIQDLNGKCDIAVYANVPSLVAYYESCDVVIAPILYGGGTRIKILEAIAYGRPVVSTSVGAEGLGLEDDRSILIAEDMEAFARQLVRLSTTTGLSARLIGNAKKVQQSCFSPQALYHAVERMVLAEGHH